ncbi:Tuberculostearic acid methyltransferase UfaA1 [Bienertia sinuspersici]
MRIAVVGGGISGLGAAYELAKAGVNVVLHEKEHYIGGHAKTVRFDGIDLDLGFMVFNRVTYPNMMELFESLGIEMEISDMSFSVSLDKGHGCEWGSRNGLKGLFSQKSNAVNPYFWKMIQEIIKFKSEVIMYLDEHENNPDIDHSETLGHFITSRGYSELFQKAYLLFGRPQWLTVKGRSHCYVNKVREELEIRGVQVKTSCEVNSVSTNDEGRCTLSCSDGLKDVYDGCIIAVHAPDAIKILGQEATYDETCILGAFQYVYSDIYLHRDKNFMPQNPAAWSAWNFLGSIDNKLCLTYWLNVLQNIEETSLPFLVTLNPPHQPENLLLKWRTGHPIPSVAATKASLDIGKIQGKRGIWFCGAYQGYGFHEDGLKAGMTAAQGLLGRSFNILTNPKQMVPSLTEVAARLFVTRFLRQFISAGCLTLLEEGGTILAFEGSRKSCPLKVAIRIHSPQFYWKVAKEADLGLADAYIHGDFAFVDKNEGLLNLFRIFIANRDLNSSASQVNKKRGWWTPMLFTAGIASAKYFYHHVSRQNTLTQARRNISRHYDLSNELFSLFLDQTMTYSCAVFEVKLNLLLRIMITLFVRRTGCRYTGITLAEEQLKYAKQRVKEAGLQDRITFLLCDYRQLSNVNKYDRIISW